MSKLTADQDRLGLVVIVTMLAGTAAGLLSALANAL